MIQMIVVNLQQNLSRSLWALTM